MLDVFPFADFCDSMTLSEGSSGTQNPILAVISDVDYVSYGVRTLMSAIAALITVRRGFIILNDPMTDQSIVCNISNHVYVALPLV